MMGAPPWANGSGRAANSTMTAATRKGVQPPIPVMPTTSGPAAKQADQTKPKMPTMRPRLCAGATWMIQVSPATKMMEVAAPRAKRTGNQA